MEDWHRKYTKGRLKGDTYRHRSNFWSTVGYIFIWLSIFVVGSLIVSVIIYPEVGTSIKETAIDTTERVIEAFSNTADKISNPSEVSEIQKHSSQIACLSEVNEKLYYLKQKATSSAKLKILETEHFDNTQDTIDYLHKWGFKEVTSSLLFLSATLPYEDLYEKEYGFINKEKIINYNDLTIVIVKLDNKIEGTNIAVTVPLLCLDGRLTENSAKNF